MLFVFLIKHSPSLDGLHAHPGIMGTHVIQAKNKKQTKSRRKYLKGDQIGEQREALLSKGRITRNSVILQWVMSLYEVM